MWRYEEGEVVKMLKYEECEVVKMLRVCRDLLYACPKKIHDN